MNAAILRKINENASGIDVGSEEIFVSVNENEVKRFRTFTSDLLEAARYLKENGVETIALEATGIYWVTLYELLEENGFEVYLVNGAHVKNVPGRKSDVKDSQWIQELHTFGLLRSSFIPDKETRKIRTYVRLRRDHIQMAASHVQHIQKALDLMNIKLHDVISDITGVSGLNIINAIISGERNPEKLAEMCTKQISKKKREDVILSLQGNYKEEHLFSLKQAVDCWNFYQLKVNECDKQIEKLLNQLVTDKDLPNEINPPKKITHHKPDIENLHTTLMQLTGGKDPSQLPGLTDASLLELIGETGLDMSKWPTEKHFVSWCGLSPNTHKSGKMKKKYIRKQPKTKAGQIFRISANTVGQSKYLALKGFYNRIKSRAGAKVAVKATARKIAVMYYNVLKYGIEFVEQGLMEYEKRYRNDIQKYLEKKAKELGLALIPIEANA